MNRVERILVIAVCVAVGWFYVWTVRSSGDPWKFGLEQRDYYNLLLDGWLDGQLHLKVEVTPALLQVKDPYDPAQRPPGLGLHDATFFRGKYYLYFGAAPVVVLLLPFRLWAGFDLPLALAVLVFVYGGFLASVAIFVDLRRRYFGTTGTWALGLGVAVLGLAGLGPVLLRRPHMWELPIGAGYCFAMLALGCVWRSLHAGPTGLLAALKRAEPADDHGRAMVRPAERRRRAAWFGGAGLCLGLAIASRPTYLIASPFLLVPLVIWWRTERRWEWRPALAALLPLAIIGGAMAWHNTARFGHPLQFGQAYQFSLDYESKMAHFRPTHVPFNVWRYFFSAAEWSREFPFIAPAALPPKPPGFGGHDDVYGLLTNLPIAWLALLAPLALWRRDGAERRALGAWLLTAAALFAGMAGTLVCFFGSLARYQSDFAPTLMLLAVVGWLGLLRWCRATRHLAWRLALGLLGGGAAIAAAGFAVLFSLQLDGLLLERNPDQHRAVARLLNRVPAAAERLAGVRYGPLDFGLAIAPAAPGTRVPLLAAGRGGLGERLTLVHGADGRVQFEVESSFGIRAISRAVRPEPGGVARLRWLSGALLPPREHPWHGGANEAETAAAVRRLRLDFGGETVLEREPWFAGASGVLTWLAPTGAGGEGTRILDWRRDEAWLDSLRPGARVRAEEAAARVSARGVLELELTLPAGKAGEREPLVVSGRPGRGDLLAVEYGAGGEVRFVFDHWGSELRRSEPVAVAPGRPVVLRIAMESWRPPSPYRRPGPVVNGGLEVTLDGRSVWRVAAEFFAVTPVEIAVGHNPIGGTTCGPEFTGTVRVVRPAR